ncbi:MAG TPA: RNA-binding S4 domain-containing protein [Methylomirabilota bacterium]|jgi:ribosome-associated heat shock protein Hsp15|nr:RNA-binding S4 domain-containing protein [Methylomirabilota bacterium]
MDGTRLDRWLWAARFYKSRSLAHAACEGGKVDVNGQAAKPSRAVRVGDRLRLTLGEWRREVVVRGLSERRGPASAAQALYEDLSPPPPRRHREPPPVVRVPGLGRPTKRERRRLDRLRPG